MFIACVSAHPPDAVAALARALHYNPLLLQSLITFTDTPPPDPPALVILDTAGDVRIPLPRVYGSGAVTVAGVAEAPAALGTFGGLLPRAAAPGLHGRLGARHPDPGAVLELLAPDIPLPPSAVWQTAAAAVRRLRPAGVGGANVWTATWRGDPGFYAATAEDSAVGIMARLAEFAAPACAVCGPADPVDLMRACAESRLRGESARPVTTQLDRPPERVAFYLGDSDSSERAVTLLLAAWRAGSAVELRRIGGAPLPSALAFFSDPADTPLAAWLPARAELESAARVLYP